jgi:hypothetical protein
MTFERRRVLRFGFKLEDFGLDCAEADMRTLISADGELATLSVIAVLTECCLKM